MENGGELIVRTRPRGAELQLEVIDTGPGIPPEVQPRIFEAYFTTRPGGTGLGLAICRRILEEMNGHIELHSEMGKGSDLVMVLPLALESSGPPHDAARGTETKHD
jgi:signal transduction histidine kinase